VEEVTDLTQPDRVIRLHGGEKEYRNLIRAGLSEGALLEMNQEKYPGCYLHRSSPNDVARTEHLTFICSRKKEDAGPTNNWRDPGEAKEKLSALFRGCMKGRTMYVIPYLMGPADSPFSQAGCEVTDSVYVAASMTIMTRAGDVALELIGDSPNFVKGLHSVGELDPERRLIAHFPEERAIWSFGSGYGGNALLGKKCHALRIASAQARDEGWMAEHMLILGLERPGEETIYMAAAFPSASGKTSLAMLKNPEFEAKGIKIRTVGDDIAWMRIGEDGRLRAINPEAGFFGVAPGSNWETNPNAMETIRTHSLYTNVALSPDGIPWWEGLDENPPADLIDWKGDPWNGEGPAAHPNSRFTAPIANCPSRSPEYDNPRGVPISAILFGGRRARLEPLVYGAYNWNHGVFIGASMASETTAAATDATGIARRDPMAMLPFCGYHMGDYFAHWLEMGEKIPRPPSVFHVNWFRKSEDGQWLWPGYGDNVRVLLWIADRLAGKARATETPIGYVPTPDSLNLEDLDLAPETLAELLSVDKAAWKAEAESLDEHFAKFGDRLPEAIKKQHAALKERLNR
jgi:phosphoenolpyruvate carboxykinase (GTP)